MTGGADLAHQLEAGIGDQWRAGVRHQRDRAALRQRLQNLRTRRFRIVLVILLERRCDRIALGQAARDAGVLAGDDIDAGERLKRPQGDVAEIADGCRDQIETRRGLRRREPMGIDGETARGGVLSFRRIYRGRLCAHNEANLGTIRRAGNRLVEKDRARIVPIWGARNGRECDRPGSPREGMRAIAPYSRRKRRLDVG